MDIGLSTRLAGWLLEESTTIRSQQHPKTINLRIKLGQTGCMMNSLYQDHVVTVIDPTYTWPQQHSQHPTVFKAPKFFLNQREV